MNKMNDEHTSAVIGGVESEKKLERFEDHECSDGNTPLCFTEDPEKNHRYSIWLNTVTRTPSAVTDIPEDLDDEEFRLIAYLRAIKVDPGVVNIIPHWNYEYCYTILTEHPELAGVLSCERLPDNILELVLKDHPKTIKYVPSNRLTMELAEIVLKQDGMLIKVFPDWMLDERLILIAVKNNPKAFEYVNGSLITKRLIRQYLLTEHTNFVMIPDHLCNYMKKISEDPKRLKRLRARRRD